MVNKVHKIDEHLAITQNLLLALASSTSYTQQRRQTFLHCVMLDGTSLTCTSRHSSCHFSNLLTSASLPYRRPNSAVWHCIQRVFFSLFPHWRCAARRSKLLRSPDVGTYVKPANWSNQLHKALAVLQVSNGTVDWYDNLQAGRLRWRAIARKMPVWSVEERSAANALVSSKVLLFKWSLRYSYVAGERGLSRQKAGDIYITAVIVQWLMRHSGAACSECLRLWSWHCNTHNIKLITQRLCPDCSILCLRETRNFDDQTQTLQPPLHGGIKRRPRRKLV